MARRLAPGVWLLDVGLVPPLSSNAYLVDDAAATAGAGAEVTLVDAGFFWNRRSLTDELRSAGYAVGDVDRVLLTHYDLDHTGGLSRIAGELSAPVHIGAADRRLLAGEANPDLRHPKGLFHRIARRVAPLPADLRVEPVADGDRIGPFQAYHTPGHNPGHTVYVHEAGVAFLGDLVWEDDGELTPPVWLDSYDMGRVRESIRALAARDLAFEVACVGHGRPLAEDGRGALDRLAERV